MHERENRNIKMDKQKKINVIIQNLCQFNSVPLKKTYHGIENFIPKEINVLVSNFHGDFILSYLEIYVSLKKFQYRNWFS